MRTWQIEKLYSEKVLPKGNIPQDRLKMRRVTINEKKYSKKELSTIIASKDVNLTPGSSSKDVRLQPQGDFKKEDFEKILKDADLEIVKTVFPGEEGSTSGQFVTYIVKDEEGNEYPVVLGKGKGSTLKAENITIEDLQEQIEAILLENDEHFFYVDVNDTKIKVNGIESTKGTPKSDFSLTYKGKPVVFISHKDGKSPKDFQQYGGMTCKSGKGVCEHEEVKQLVVDLKQKFPDGLEPKQYFFRKIKSDDLKLMSIYGGDYGEEFGEDNVHVVLQGRVKFEKIGDNTYELTANHVMYNGDLPLKEDEYEPMFFIRFSGSRPSGNYGIKNSRFMIVPRGLISSKIQSDKILSQNIKAISKSEQEINQQLNQ